MPSWASMAACRRSAGINLGVFEKLLFRRFCLDWLGAQGLTSSALGTLAKALGKETDMADFARGSPSSAKVMPQAQIRKYAVAVIRLGADHRQGKNCRITCAWLKLPGRIRQRGLTPVSVPPLTNTASRRHRPCRSARRRCRARNSDRAATAASIPASAFSPPSAAHSRRRNPATAVR